MAWSDAARAAALEARRMHAKAKASTYTPKSFSKKEQAMLRAGQLPTPYNQTPTSKSSIKSQAETIAAYNRRHQSYINYATKAYGKFSTHSMSRKRRLGL